MKKLRDLPWDMKIAYTLMRIQEFYVLHKGKIKVVICDDKDRAGIVLGHLTLSKYPTLEVTHGVTTGIFHDGEGFDPMMIWNEEDLNRYYRLVEGSKFNRGN